MKVTEEMAIAVCEVYLVDTPRRDQVRDMQRALQAVFADIAEPEEAYRIRMKANDPMVRRVANEAAYSPEIVREVLKAFYVVGGVPHVTRPCLRALKAEAKLAEVRAYVEGHAQQYIMAALRAILDEEP